MSGLGPWLASKEPDSCSVRELIGGLGQARSRSGVPLLLRLIDPFGGTAGLIDGTPRLALMVWPPDRPLRVYVQTDEPPFPLHVISYGPDDALAARLIQQIAAWAAADCPTVDQVHITVYPRGTDYVPAAGEYLLVRPSIQLVLRWPA